MPIIDFHNHVMPGVDDGARTPEDSTAALSAMASAGVATVIATPHLNASLAAHPDQLEQRLGELDEGWAALTKVAADGSLRVLRGAEVALDTPTPVLSDERFRLAGTDFVLVEFAYMTVPPNAVAALRRIRDAGWIPVVAHPERYGAIRESVDQALEWKRAGALLQMNGGSLLGRYGPEVKRAARQLLARGWADYLCSDYHTRTGPWITEYRQWLVDHGAEEQAGMLMSLNPERMLQGELPLAVAPLLDRRGLWDRVRSVFR
ncbi:MAG TPA: CpsB/CapC family capsule biosynthesis tyrosine phosphatase [Longimicrobiales bacterium]|nr:CpsB/CapC family capsule biosynthesis tyrosine phosphatase [Longimicrobiales bacterium]